MLVSESSASGMRDAVGAVNGTVGGEVGTLDKLHQILYRTFGIVNAVDGGVNDLTQVMGGDVGRHTDGDTHRTVDEQVREARRKNRRLLQTVIKVGHHGNNVLIEVDSNVTLRIEKNMVVADPSAQTEEKK